MAQKKKKPETVSAPVTAIEDFDASVLAPIRKERPLTHTVGPEDTLSSIAHAYCPDDMDVDQFVRHLNLLNNRPQISKGMVIKLFGGK